MGRTVSWVICDAITCVLNVVLHSIGLLLLRSIYRMNQKTSHLLILVNLSIVEILKNFIHLLHEFIDITQLFIGVTHVTELLHHYIQFFRNIGFMLQFFSIMFLITAYRLSIVYPGGKLLPLRSRRKVRIILAVTWSVNMSLIAITALMYKFTGIRGYVKYFYLYVDVALGIVFFLFTVFTYSCIFIKTVRSDQMTHVSRTRRESALSILRNTQYPITIILVLSFLLLTILPDVLYTILVLNDTKSRGLDVYIGMSKLFSDTVDAVIYILLQDKVRKLLMKKLRFVKKRKRKTYIVSQIKLKDFATLSRENTNNEMKNATRFER